MKILGGGQAERRPFGIELRMRLSRTRAMLATTLGVPQGFFTQYEYAHLLEPVHEPYPEVESMLARSPYGEVLQDIQAHRQTFAGFQDADGPRLGRGMFPALDGMAAYALTRRLRPKRILEIGSGDSTFFLAQAVEDNGFGSVRCIDPQPRRDIAGLDVTIERRLMANCDANYARALEPNDILFIDSSHIMLPGTDVDIQFNRVFPRLNPGVYVHLHDVFLPDDYPANWRLRNYSEQNALMGWILSGYFDVIWAGHFMLTRHRPLVDEAVGDLMIGSGAGSLWLRRAERPSPPAAFV
jgi:hypothetical protein